MMNGNNYPNGNYQPQGQGQNQQQAPGGYVPGGNIPNYYGGASASPAASQNPSYSAPSYTAPAYEVKPAAPKADSKGILTYIILALLVINLLVGVAGLFKGGSRNISTIKKDSKTITEYERNLGKNSVKLTDDKVETEYSTSYVNGYVENIGSKELTSVSINIKFYQGDVCVGSGSDYISYLEPGAKVKFSVGAYDVESFDSYEIMPIEASDY